MTEFQVYYRGTNLIAGPSIFANSAAQARQILRRQEKDTAKAFTLRQAA